MHLLYSRHYGQAKDTPTSYPILSDEQVCIDTVAAFRWPNGPSARSAATRALLSRHAKALEVQGVLKQFSVKVGTIFEDSPIPLDKWLVALWMLVNCKNGISSYEVGRALGITQKSAWFVLHRLRLALQSRSLVKLGGEGTKLKWTRLSSAARLATCTRNVAAPKITERGVGRIRPL